MMESESRLKAGMINGLSVRGNRTGMTYLFERQDV